MSQKPYRKYPGSVGPVGAVVVSLLMWLVIIAFIWQLVR